jgi:hypothetical protein
LQSTANLRTDQPDIHADVQLSTEFRARALGNQQESGKFLSGMSFESFGDIGGNRNRRPRDLIPESAIPAISEVSIDRCSQLPASRSNAEALQGIFHLSPPCDL